MLGTALDADKQHDEAFLEYPEILRLVPVNAQGHTPMALSLQRQGKFDEAIEDPKDRVWPLRPLPPIISTLEHSWTRLGIQKKPGSIGGRCWSWIKVIWLLKRHYTYREGTELSAVYWAGSGMGPEEHQRWGGSPL
jgi:hypothetical protein